MQLLLVEYNEKDRVLKFKIEKEPNDQDELPEEITHSDHLKFHGTHGNFDLYSIGESHFLTFLQTSKAQFVKPPVKIHTVDSYIDAALNINAMLAKQFILETYPENHAKLFFLYRLKHQLTDKKFDTLGRWFLFSFTPTHVNIFRSKLNALSLASSSTQITSIFNDVYKVLKTIVTVHARRDPMLSELYKNSLQQAKTINGESTPNIRPTTATFNH